MEVSALDSIERGNSLVEIIQAKPFLNRLYREIYDRYRECLSRCPKEGIAIELGSGGGFAKEVLPELTTTDILAYEKVDRVVDATQMPFEDESLRAIFLLNVFHHIPNVEKFLEESSRCLKTGGRVLIEDEYPGIIAKPILKYAHHEPFDEKTWDWSFKTTGPLSGANGALAWIVFERDRARFKEKFPALRVVRFARHSPLKYWLSGGLKSWTLVPGFLYPLMVWVDRALIKLSPKLASFVTIELEKVK
jgi:SAM-dependent methyltransferase